MPRPLIFLFPGQSSRDPDMFKRLAAVSEHAAQQARDAVETRLGRPWSPEFQTNKEVQLTVFLANHAYYALLVDAGFEPVASAGLSLGEYNHLVAIEAIDAAAAADLVAKRGEAYDAGPDGMMAAVQPMSADTAEDLIAELRERHGWPGEALGLSNDNSPSQCVVAGSAKAVETFIEAAAERHFAVATIIERRVPMHTQRFAPVADALGLVLDAAPWKSATGEYWPNVTAEPLTDADGSFIGPLLRRHVSERVQWRRTIDSLDARYPDAVFVEVGPRNILGRMLTRRWIGKERVVSLDDALPFAETLAKLGGCRV